MRSPCTTAEKSPHSHEDSAQLKLKKFQVLNVREFPTSPRDREALEVISGCIDGPVPEGARSLWILPLGFIAVQLPTANLYTSLLGAEPTDGGQGPLCLTTLHGISSKYWGINTPLGVGLT